MVAILGALLEENDIDGRLIPHQFSIPGEITDMRVETNHIGVLSAVPPVRIFSFSFYSSSHHSNTFFTTQR
jgi:hypothetical protein